MMRVTVYERIEIAPGTDAPWRYKSVDTGHWPLTVSEAPEVGDYTSWGRVIARSWMYPDKQRFTDALDECSVVVDPTDFGPFVDEAELTLDELDSEVPS